MKLNANEQAVLLAVYKAARDASSFDFAMGDEIAAYVPHLKGKQVAGYLADLKARGLVTICKVDSVEQSGLTQIIPGRLVSASNEEGFNRMLELGAVVKPV